MVYRNRSTDGPSWRRHSTQSVARNRRIDCGARCRDIDVSNRDAGADINQAAESGATPLYIACQEGQLECVRLLLEAGAAISQARDNGATPLFMACQQGHLECARLLLEASAAVDQARDDGVTPLLIACEKGHLDIVRLLLEASAAVGQANARGATPLFIACRFGHLETARLLCDACAGRVPRLRAPLCARASRTGHRQEHRASSARG